MNQSPAAADSRQRPPQARALLRLCIVAGIVFSPLAVTWTQQPTPELGATADGLRPCPLSPNCVGSDFDFVRARNAARFFGLEMPQAPESFVEPLQLAGSFDSEWKRLTDLVKAQPDISVLTDEPHYFRAVRSTTPYGLLDDFELFRLISGTVLIRSAARMAHSDFGRNRRFVERIRKAFDQGRPEEGPVDF